MKQIYTLTCDCCGGAFESPGGFPEIQLCPSCMPKSNKMEQEELREKIATLVLCAMRSESTCMTQEEISKHWRNEILALIKEVGYMKLADDQSLPRWQAHHLCVGIFSYDSGQQDMIKEVWRKVILEE